MIVRCQIGSLVFEQAEGPIKVAIVCPDVLPPRRRKAENKALTEREREVLELMVEGLTYKQVASDLSLSTHAIKFHVANIIRKLGGRNFVYAAVQATRFGLVKEIA